MREQKKDILFEGTLLSLLTKDNIWQHLVIELRSIVLTSPRIDSASSWKDPDDISVLHCDDFI